MEIFEKYLRNDKKASDNTLNSYLRDIRQLAVYLEEETDHDLLTADEAAAALINRYNHLFFDVRGDDRRLTWAKWAFPVINDTECLKEIDHYLQDSLRYVIYGSMKVRNRTVLYEKFGELGYKSLMYYYHHPDKVEELISEGPKSKKRA